MKRTLLKGVRRLAYVAPLVLWTLAGCQGDKIIARIGNQTVTEKDLYERALVITPSDIQNSPDVGSAALVSLIRDKITLQLAQEKGAIPSDEVVRKYLAYTKRLQPQIETMIASGRVSEEELFRNARLQLMNFSIGTDNLKADAKKVEERYKELQNKPAEPTGENPIKLPERWTVKQMPVPDLATGQKVLAELQKTGDFKKAAQGLQVPDSAIREVTVEVKELAARYPEVKKALETVEPGKFAPQPQSLKVPNPNGAGAPMETFLILQVLRKDAPVTFPLEDMRPILEQMVISETNKSWMQRSQQLTADQTRKLLEGNQVQIYVDRYKYIINSFVKPISEANMPMAPGSAPPPGGATGAAPVPDGATAPPPTGGGTPPTVQGGAGAPPTVPSASPGGAR